MSSKLRILHCAIIGATGLPDRLLASGVLAHTPDPAAVPVCLSYVFEVTKPWFPESRLLPTLIDTLNQEYVALSGGKELGDQFEALLKRLNQSLNQISESGETDWIGNLNGIVACLFDSQLHFSQTGHCPAYLLQRNRIRQITDPPGEEREIHPLKTFSNIASGELQADDRLIFANQELYREVSLDALRRLIAAGSPYEACQQIGRQLRQDRNGSVAAVALAVTAPEQMQRDEPIEITMDELLEHRLKRAHRLMLPHFQRAHGAIRQGAQAVQTVAREQAIPAVSAGLRQAGTAVSSVQKRLQPEPHGAPTIEIIAPGGTLAAEELGTQTAAKPRLAPVRIYAIAAAVLLIAVTLVVTVHGIRKGHPSSATASDPDYLSAQADSGKAASLIASGDAAGAADQVSAGQSALAKAADRKAVAASLLTAAALKLQAQEDALTQTTRLSATATYELGEAGSALVYAKPYVYVATGNGLLRVREDDGTTTAISLPAADPIISLTPSTSGPAVALVLTKSGTVYQVIQSSDLTTLQKVSPASGSFMAGTALVSYNANLYVLDASGGAFWRYADSGTSYSAGTDILPAQKDALQQSVAAAIDGSIYLLGVSGTIGKYTAGIPDSGFSVTGIPALSTPLAKPAQIITDASTPDVYVLDRGTTLAGTTSAKMLELTKGGTFVQEYAAPASDAEVDAISLDLQSKTMWILSGNSLQELSLP